MRKYVQVKLFFLLFVVYTGSVVSAAEKMTMHAYEIKLFQNFMTPEQQVYELLCAKPIEKNVNYLAISRGHFFRQKNLEKIKFTKKLKNGFTVCQHIRYREIIPVLRRLGINILFAPHAPKKQQYKDIIVLPFPLYPINGIGSAQKKDLLYSFIGLESHPVRRKIFSLPRRPGIIIKKRSRWHFHLRQKIIMALKWSQRREQEREEYQDVLARSRFSLCPRGTGPSTIRFWESLQAGAIPVLLADAMALPKIEGINWNDCIVRLPERSVSSVDRIIRAILPEKEASMRENCLRAFELSCAGENFVQTIRDYFAL